MPKYDANQSTLERLQNDPETEVTSLELRQKLEAELSKPADEIDARLVDSILARLDDYEPTEEQKAAGWDAVVRKVEAGRRQRRIKVARRVAAAAAAVVIVFVVFSVGTARAFRWTFLLEWLEPLAETFGIHTEIESPTPTICPAELVIGQTSYSQTEYALLEEMPAEIDGYATVPGWVPERFKFSSGWIYRDENMDIVDTLFTADEDNLICYVNITRSENYTMDYDYEKRIGEYRIAVLGGLEVTIYDNANDGSLSASWINKNASYSIMGTISEDELKRIMESI
jgi:hypothetical protein